MDVIGTEPHATRDDGHQRGEARAEELHNLRLALATFAVQLDVFEMRVSGTARAIQRTATGCALVKEKMIDRQ